MKKNIFCLVALLCGAFAFSQLNAQSCITFAGGSVMSGSGEFSFTMGEIATQSVEGSVNILQGVQQPFSNPVAGPIAVPEVMKDDIAFSLFPNPIRQGQKVHLEVIKGELQSASDISVYDLQGRCVYTGKMSDAQLDIDVQFASGTYAVILKNAQSEQTIAKLVVL